jgi:imidazolonepropionase-like amidohydrolase
MQGRISRRSVLAGGLALGVVGAVGVTGCASEPPSPPLPPPAPVAADGVIAITGVTVVDVDAGRRRPATMVLVRGDRIAEIGPTARVRVPPGATAVDGTGKFLIPGLADMHVHTVPLERTFPPLYLVNGVTTVREMGGNPDAVTYRDRVAAGAAFGPRSQATRLLVDGSPSLWEGIGPPYVAVADAAQARAAVREQHAAGADFIKVYTRLSPEAFHAIAEETRELGIPFLGHCSDFVPLPEASDAGIRSIEHLWQFWYAASREEARLRREVAAVPIAGGEYGGWYRKMHDAEYAAARSTDRRKAARVLDRLASNRTFVTPTLVQHRIADTPSTVRADDPRARYLPAPYTQIMEAQLQQIYMQGRTHAQNVERRELFERRMDLVPELAEAGVPLLAGTDTGTPSLVPGFALHEELELLVRAGLTTAQALRAATLEPARYLGLEDERGSIAPGKVADLVLLDADPLRDITNTTRIDSVVVRGCLLDGDAREQMLDDVLAASQDPAAAAAPVPMVCACCR